MPVGHSPTKHPRESAPQDKTPATEESPGILQQGKIDSDEGGPQRASISAAQTVRLPLVLEG